jgi:hypothetical protein
MNEWMNECDMFRLLHMADDQPQDKSPALPSNPHLSSPQTSCYTDWAIAVHGFVKFCSKFRYCRHFNAISLHFIRLFLLYKCPAYILSGQYVIVTIATTVYRETGFLCRAIHCSRQWWFDTRHVCVDNAARANCSEERHVCVDNAARANCSDKRHVCVDNAAWPFVLIRVASFFARFMCFTGSPKTNFECRWCSIHWNFSLTYSHYGPGVDSASNRNKYQEYSLGGKGGRCVGLTSLHI